ncbi:MAG: TIGR03767 family metallophosphoesterase [Candidatus Nanopelagicales bacterium]|nr:TIGR03767 family metallophosphoesterase [Candidatus Nanopelagicales bacterium]
MADLSRRAFMATTAALAGAFALPQGLLGSALAAPSRPSRALSTLQQTIMQAAHGADGYRKLLTTGGEPYVPRFDLLGKTADAGRLGRQRSLLYVGHASDVHIVDAQAPARLEPVQQVAAELLTDCTRPQETLTVNVLAAMIKAMAELKHSPLTGAPLSAILNTGDNADSKSSLELRWYIDMFDGGSVTPNSGSSGVYEGVQLWEGTSYAWHPDDPANDVWGSKHGFPRVPGLLTAAVSQEVESVGAPAPWYSVFGNHDIVYAGFLRLDPSMSAYSVGDRKAAEFDGLATWMFDGLASGASQFQRLANTIATNFGFRRGTKTVTPDASREIFDPVDFMEAHFETEAFPGPVGHGFTQDNLDSGETWWAADISPFVRVFGLDTCNKVCGADGSMTKPQFDWLEEELAATVEEGKLAIVMSHHNSLTMENPAQPTAGPSVPLVDIDDFIAMLHRYPNMIAWLNGHTHTNTILAHPDGNGHGFWEVTTASCIDFPQQQQMVEIVDNQDGTMSIFTTVVDHASAASWTEGDLSQYGLASLSRELASNSFLSKPMMRRGSPLDRNTELLMKSPIDLSKITNEQLARQRATDQARLVKWETERAS